MQNTWVSRIGIVALFGGLWLVNDGLRVTPATAASPVKEYPHAGLKQNWDKVLPAAERFVILTAFTSDAVLDKSTGLVWETSSQMAPANGAWPASSASTRRSAAKKAGVCRLSQS